MEHFIVVESCSGVLLVNPSDNVAVTFYEFGGPNEPRLPTTPVRRAAVTDWVTRPPSPTPMKDWRQSRRRREDAKKKKKHVRFALGTKTHDGPSWLTRNVDRLFQHYCSAYHHPAVTGYIKDLLRHSFRESTTPLSCTAKEFMHAFGVPYMRLQHGAQRTPLCSRGGGLNIMLNPGHKRGLGTLITILHHCHIVFTKEEATAAAVVVSKTLKTAAEVVRIANARARALTR
jgi:hypothetical protein